MRFPHAPLLFALASLLVSSLSHAADPVRGKLLYETRCDTCHDTGVHQRASRAAQSFEGIRLQVVRWDRQLGGAWRNEEIDDVTLYLNDRYYFFSCPESACRPAQGRGIGASTLADIKRQVFAIRYADDAVLCFQCREDAEKVLRVLPKRFAKYGLTLHPEKTRLVAFGRQALAKAQRTGTKPATFEWLGFTHLCARSRRGKFTVHVKSMKKRLRRAFKAIAAWCREHRHDPVGWQQQTLNAKLRGHYQYYGRPTNYRSLWQFYRGVRRVWHKWLTRRTRGKTLTWSRYAQLLARHPLLRPRITQPWASTASLT